MATMMHGLSLVPDRGIGDDDRPMAMAMMAGMAGFTTSWTDGDIVHGGRDTYRREQLKTNRQLREHLLTHGLLGVPAPPGAVSTGADVVQQRQRRRLSTPSALLSSSCPTSTEFKDGVIGDGRSAGTVRTNDRAAERASPGADDRWRISSTRRVDRGRRR